MTHAPRDRSGKIICWDAVCWAGCTKTAAICAHFHEIIKGLGGLDWTVQAQLIWRGGLKSGAKVDPTSVDGRIAQLRAQAKTEADGKRAGGAPPGGQPAGTPPAGALAAGGGRVGGPPPVGPAADWTAPEEYGELPPWRRRS